MPIDEIEIPGSSLSFKCWTARVESIPALMSKIMDVGDMFDTEEETRGFHDLDSNGTMIRGFYSGVIPFEVEHLVDGINTTSLMKRIESCEFFLFEDCLLTIGKSDPEKGLAFDLSGMTGSTIAKMEFEFDQLSRFHDRLSELKAIVITNPKDKEIKRARLAGHIENYTEYNILDAKNHGMESVSGMVSTPLGPMTVGVTRKGSVRLGVRKGLILTVDCLRWILSLVRNDVVLPPREISISVGSDEEADSCRP